ncbi:hypothetical protein PT276_08080 [Orbaceae bacterium ESL0721]|nr:hypothetical protein [Orbaceae bacterium ESL0721]
MRDILHIFVFLITIFLSFCSYAFTKAGYYEIDSKNWVANATPVGDVFVCSTCDGLTQIQISYGVEISKNSPVKTFDGLAKTLNTEATKKKYVKEIVEDTLPTKDFRVEIERVEETKISGFRAIQYLAHITFPQGQQGSENGIITIHKNRILRISINYFPNASEKDFKNISQFLSSFKLK